MKRYSGPALWMFGQNMRGPGTAESLSAVPHGNPFVDQFSRYFPNLQVQRVDAGHFFPEEAPDVTNAALLRFLPEPLAADALLVIPGVLSVAPQYLRPQRAASVHVSFELRMRGGASYRMAVDDGTAVVGAAGEKADCVITADPVAFLLLGYGRISQLSPVLRGQLRPGGRKPWLAMKFGTLLSSP